MSNHDMSIREVAACTSETEWRTPEYRAVRQLVRTYLSNPVEAGLVPVIVSTRPRREVVFVPAPESFVEFEARYYDFAIDVYGDSLQYHFTVKEPCSDDLVGILLGSSEIYRAVESGVEVMRS